MTLRRMAARLAASVRARKMDEELGAEVEAHLELAERDGMARGLSAAEARREALMHFGGMSQMREEHRETRGLGAMEHVGRDLRHGFALLAREPGFAAVCAGLLALGIGASVAMFSILDTALLKPLPFADPERIVRVWEAPRPGVSNATSTLDYLDWRRMNSAFDALSASRPVAVAMSGSGEPVRLRGAAVTSSFFRVFPTRPLLGSVFTEADEQPGAGGVIVLSHSAWRSYFGADVTVLGRPVALDGETYRVVAVLSPGPGDLARSDFWMPLVFSAGQRIRDWHWLEIHGRMRPGVTLDRAKEDMNSIQAALGDTMPVWKRDWKIEVQRVDRLLVGDRFRQSVYVVFGAVLLVLLIASANVASLLLGRGAARGKEMAVRMALGASRGRIAAQLTAETVALCLVGGAGGLLFAWLLVQISIPFVARTLPYALPPAIDWRVLAFATGIGLGTGLLTAVMPSFRTSAGSLERFLRQAGRGSSGDNRAIRKFIVVGEVALSLVLVCGAMLLFRSLDNLQRVETRARIENILTMPVELPGRAYPSAARAALLYDSLSERMKAIPGVVDTAISTQLPLQWIGNGEAVRVPGVSQWIKVRFKRVDPGYFKTFGIPMVAGRGIAPGDREGAARVAVINEALARRLAEVAGMGNPVGQTVTALCPRYGQTGGEERQVGIAGIAFNERTTSAGMQEPPVIYVPLAQTPSASIQLIVRSQGEFPSLAQGLREAVREVDPNLPRREVISMQEIHAMTLSGASRPAWMIGTFSVVAVLLTAIGLYSVIAETVLRRRREIGIRMALGARAGDVAGQLIREGLLLVATGLALGMMGVFALMRVVKSLLYGVSPFDPAAILAACLTMAVIGLLAGLIPAARAARVDPVITLREEG